VVDDFDELLQSLSSHTGRARKEPNVTYFRGTVSEELQIDVLGRDVLALDYAVRIGVRDLFEEVLQLLGGHDVVLKRTYRSSYAPGPSTTVKL